MYERHFLRAATSGASSGGGPKITPEMLNSLLAGIGQAVQKGGPVAEQVTTTLADGIAKGSNQPAKAGGILKSGLNLLKTVAPMALSFIPGGGAVSGVAKALLSTLNDDEWFSKHTGNGAAFNQFLKDELRNGVQADVGLLEPIAVKTAKTQAIEGRLGFASIPTAISYWSNPIWDDFMPQVVADVRRVTNNVLVDDTITYTEAFYYATNLLAMYYTLRKYLEISANQPLNIPMLTSGMTIIAPENLNLIRGITDGLEQYIDATIRLPYAITAYIRWRYGSAFLSDNTGKPALILYDWVPESDVTVGYASNTNTFFGNQNIATIAASIKDLQTHYVACGRAGSDIKLTYDSHDRRNDVEKSHYDEKEFNLRCNFDIPTQSFSELTGFNVAMALQKVGKEVVMDSRLDMNAAIQAVTISSMPAEMDGSSLHTTDRYTFFQCIDIRLAYYQSTTLGIATNSRLFGSIGWKIISFVEAQGILYHISANMIDAIEFAGNQTSVRIANATYSDHAVVGKYFDVPYALLGAALMLPSLLSSGQFHNRYYSGFGMRLRTISDAPNGYVALMPSQTLLSYDTAYIAKESLEAIQRSAIRNLVRADYKRKDVAAVKSDVADGVKDLLAAGPANLNKI